MSWVPAEQVLQVVAQQRQVIAAQEARMATFAGYHAAERAKLEAELAQAQKDLGVGVLPRLDARSIVEAASATGFVGLPTEDVPGQLEARRRWLAARLTEISRDPRYANAELLRHPRTGSLPRAIAETLEHKRPWFDFVTTCEAHPRFDRLIATDFGTPQQQTSWWRYSFWQDRSSAEALCKEVGKETFADVRATYERAKQDVATFDAELAGLHAEVAAGEKLYREYAAFWDEHQHLDARGLEHTRGRIVQHLLGTDASYLGQRLRAASSPLLPLFLRASGLASKIAYLDGIQRQSLGELQKELAAQREKLDVAEQRTKRRWAPMPLEKFQKLAEDRSPRFEKRWQRFGKIYSTVHVYDRWDRGRYYDDLLWWDVMTRGRYDGSYMSDVAQFHTTHPAYAFNPDWKSLAAASPDDGDAAPISLDADADADAAAASVDADADADAGADGAAVDLATTDAS